MTSQEQRTQERARYLLQQASVQVVSERAQTYFEERSVPGFPALVLDMSSGGLQVVTDNKQPLTVPEYALELVTEGELPFAEGHVQLLWTRTEGGMTRHGFKFVSGFAPLAEVEAMLRNDRQRVLRCVLHPIPV